MANVFQNIIRPIIISSNNTSVFKHFKLLKDKAFINNSWVSSIDEKVFNVLNPLNNEVIIGVPDMSVDDANDAVNAAHEAFKKWRLTTATERSKLLKNWYKLIMENHEELSKIITLENGKPIQEARGEITYGADYIEWFAEECRRTYGDTIPSSSSSKRIVTIKQPIGVAGLITPWNFPNAMITRKVAPALAAGCTVVVKPSEETPLSALALCQLAKDAGFPSGVLNIITSSRINSAIIGEFLCTSPLISKISFTGSTAVGKILLKHCSSSVKKASMELGGNAPFIVFDTANLDAAIAGLMASKFRFSGQTCVCTNRVLIQSSIHDQFVEKLTNAITTLKLGDGMNEGTTQGPLINLNAVKKVESHVKDAIEKGAKVIKGGKRYNIPGVEFSNFYEPTILTGVNSDFLCCQEETFGPLAPLIKFQTEEEAIRIANGVSSGLAGYIFSGDPAQIWRVAESLETGMVGINDGLISSVQFPFGGIKESGFGREGSKYGMDEYMVIKALCFGGI